VLRNYFCDKDAEALRSGNSWELSLSWPGGEERHVDPALEVGLKLWGGLRREEMAMARRRNGRVLRALYDTWTLYSWSKWFARVGHRPGSPLTILHVDDHRDLGCPRLFRRNGGWMDPVTGSSFDLFKPETVFSAIESGAVGMGSFLTPILERFPHADVRQLGQHPKVTRTTDFKVELIETLDQFLEPGALRPQIRLSETADRNGLGRYRITNNVNHWVKDVGTGPILLHIDMDYFNNRYDGDGDWRERTAILDPPLNEVLDEIRRVTTALHSADLVNRIEDAVIAYSPGFFPSEMWEEADRHLERGLEQLYG
jgi:hypothetical protein